MDLRDFISLVSVLITVGLPLAAIHFIFGRVGRISRKGRMSDAFVIWIVWLLSAVAAIIPIAILDIEVRFSRMGAAFLSIPAVAAYVVSSIGVFFVMRSLSSSQIDDIAGSLSNDDPTRNNLSLRNVLLVSGGAALALAVGIGVTIVLDAGYTYLFPPKDNPFNIYALKSHDGGGLFG